MYIYIYKFLNNVSWWATARYLYIFTYMCFFLSSVFIIYSRTYIFVSLYIFLQVFNNIFTRTREIYISKGKEINIYRRYIKGNVFCRYKFNGAFFVYKYMCIYVYIVFYRHFSEVYDNSHIYYIV